MANVRLKSGHLMMGDDVAGSDAELEKEALLVYEGSFQSMDGPVEITEEKLSKLVSSHNGKIEGLKRMYGGEVPLKHYPPVQLDHSQSAEKTVGRICSPLRLGEYKDEEGNTKKAIYAKIKILGRENVEKVKDGRWSNLSIGADLENEPLSLNELSITPFPAAENAMMLSKKLQEGTKMATVKEVTYKGKQYKIERLDAVGPSKKTKYQATSGQINYYTDDYEDMKDAQEEMEQAIDKKVSGMSDESKDTKMSDKDHVHSLEYKGKHIDYVHQGEDLQGNDLGWTHRIGGPGKKISDYFRTKEAAIADAKKRIDQGKDSVMSSDSEGTNMATTIGYKDHYINVQENKHGKWEAWVYPTDSGGRADATKAYNAGVKASEKDAVSAAKAAIDSNKMSEGKDDGTKMGAVAHGSPVKSYKVDEVEVEIYKDSSGMYGALVTFPDGKQRSNGMDFKDQAKAEAYANQAAKAGPRMSTHLAESYKGKKIEAGQDPRTGGFAPKIDGVIYDYGCDHSQEAIQVAKKIIDGEVKVDKLSEGDTTMGAEQEVKKDEVKASEGTPATKMASPEEIERVKKGLEAMGKTAMWDEKLGRFKVDEMEMDYEAAKQLAAQSAVEEPAKLARKAEFVRLAKAFKDTSSQVSLAQKKTSIVTRLSRLKASAKITPAEIKKMDLTKLAKSGEATIEAVLKSYEDREPVISTGVFGTMKATNLAALEKTRKMAALEAETRMNMSLKRTQLSNQEEAKMGEDAPKVSMAEEAVPSKMADEDCMKHMEALKQMKHLLEGDDKAATMKHLEDVMARYSEGKMLGGDEGMEQMSAEKESDAKQLEDGVKKLHTQMKEMQQLVGPLLGVSAADLE